MSQDGQPKERVHVFGIRHHGPGSARSLRLALERLRPDAILIEGPADADPLVPHVAAEGMQPPVAIVAYVPDEPARAAFWPFAAFSPEWQALRYAVEHDLPARFCDLPSSMTLADDRETGRGDPLGELAAAAGYNDAEHWWDAVVESHAGADVFAAVTEAMSELRDMSGTDPAILRREAYMRQVLRKTLKSGAERVAVVCGAWHAPALAGRLGPAAADSRQLKGLPKVITRSTWIPWTHSRLASASGYGAGVDSPGWYSHLFTETRQPVAAWLTKVASALRANDLPVSSAHIIEAVRLAETLAVIRDRPLPGLSEVTEATRAVLCDGNETVLRLVGEKLVVGEELGSVPAETPTVPLANDVAARARSLRLKQDPRPTTLNLDLRKERDLAKSRLLHQLQVLEVHWGTRGESAIRGTGTFRETWTLQWRPEFSIAVIEAARWGTTVHNAAEAKVLDIANTANSTIVELTTALTSTLLADLGRATEGVVAALASAAAVDNDVNRLLTALPGVVRTLRYGDVRGTDTSALARIADGILVRISAALPAAITGLGTDSALELRTLLESAHTTIVTRADSWGSEIWLNTLHRLAGRTDVHGALTGRFVRLLSDAGSITANDVALRLSAALSVGRTAVDKAAWIDGFVRDRGLILVHDRELVQLIDDWLTGLTDEQFTETLPLLRRTFGTFETGERRAIGQAVRNGAPTLDKSSTTEPDCARGVIALHAVANILGVPA